MFNYEHCKGRKRLLKNDATASSPRLIEKLDGFHLIKHPDCFELIELDLVGRRTSKNTFHSTQAAAHKWAKTQQIATALSQVNQLFEKRERETVS